MIGILIQCKRTGTTTRTVYNDWDTHPVQTYWHCNKASIQRLGYSSSANVLALQQDQYTTIGILIQCERTCTATRPVQNDWDTHPVQTYWHCNKDSTQRLGYSSSTNVLALQQGQYTTIGILTQCKRTGPATRPVHNVGYSRSTNVLALQQGQYTTIGILTQSFSLQKVIQQRYRNESCVDEGGLKKDFFSILMAQLLASNLLTQYTDNVGYSPSVNVLALQQGHCTQRLGYSPSANVLALQQGQCTQRSAAWWRRCCSKERA